jgi:serine/threonine-protein kinase
LKHEAASITRIGRYEVQSEIGHGTFGRVFRAYDPVTRRNVAIKVLIAENDPDVLARFFLEVQATAKLKHKNIVTIYDFNETPPYIVMELVEGESLQQIITDYTALSLLEKVRILSQAAEGLACAHKNGIVHRDIKPANIMVLPDGDVKVMDFGIARVSGETEARRTRQGDLVGTILYMSPERIQGAEADPCSDIFSFGAVGCELITGKHPFEGKDYATVIYKITSTEAPPIQQLIPECPEALDLVIQRAMAKEPEGRYQSMEDVLLDLKPVLLELAQEQAAPVMREVQRLIDSGQFSEALDRVHRVLELDPTNPEARRVHDSLQKDQRLRQVRTKVDALLREGGDQLAQRQFNRAIQCFDSAWRLDSSDTHVNDLLGQAKAALEANRQASRLLSEARREMLAGNLDAAYEDAAGALKADPHHHDAEVLCEKLRQQIEQRDKRLRAERGIHRAEELLAQKDFSGARAVLAEIEPESDPAAIDPMRARIEAEEAEQVRLAREQRVQQGVARARQQLQASQLAEAEETLRTLLDEFPDATAASRLLATIREHIEAHRRAEAIGKLTQQALSLVQSQDLLAARRTLESALQSYPSDAGLQRLLDWTLDLQRAYEWTQAIAELLEQARTLQASGRTDDALALIKQAPTQYGSDAALAELKRQLEFDLEQQQYAAGLRDALAKGQELIDAGRFADAAMALEASLALYPAEPGFASLLASARQAQAEQEERQSVAEVMARVNALGSGQQWQDALECAEEALKRYPYNATLSEMTARTRENWRQQQQQYNVARRRETIEQALASGNLTRAANELQTARQDSPGEQGFDELEERLRQAQVQAQLDSLEQQVRQSLARGDLDSASQQLTGAHGWADHPRWQALQRELVRRQGYQHSLQRARQLNELKDYQAAKELLEQLVRDNPPDNEAATLLPVIRSEQRRVESERAYREALEEAERLRRAGDYNRAQQVLQEAVRQALDQRAEELLKTVIAERGQVERQRLFEQGKKDIRDLIDRGAIQNALAAIDKLQRDFREDRELGQLRATAEQQRDLIEALAKIRDLEQRRQFEAALDAAESVLQANPENAALMKNTGRLWQAALDQLVDTVHSCFAKSDLRRGGAVLEGARQRWGREPCWQALQEELEQRQAQESALREAELARKQIEQRTAKIKSLGNDARAFLKAKDFEGALPRVEAALQSFPDDPTLLELRQAIVTGRADHQRRKFTQQALDESTELERIGRVEQACASLERALQQYPGESSLTDALARNRQKLLQQQEQARVSALKRDLKQANSLIEQRQLLQAAQLLQQMKDAYPGEGEVAALLDRIRIEEQRRIALDAICAEIQRHLDAGQPDKAGEAAARGLTEFGRDPQLIAAAAAAERMRARKAALERAQAACRERNWRLAAGILETFLQQDDHDTEARRLLDEVLEREQADLRRARRENGRSEGEKLIQSGRLEEAVRCLRALHDEFPDDATIRDDLSRALAAVDHQFRREAWDQGRQRARAFLRSGQFAAAIKTLEELLRQFPDDSILKEDLKDAREAHSEQVRRERYATERRRAAGLVQARKFDDAVALLQALLVEFSADALLEEDLKSATAARELQQHREAVDREAAQLEKLYRKGDARAVRERASLLSPDLQDARVRELLDWARTEIARSEQERERESADSLQRKRKRRITVGVTAAAVVTAAIFTMVALHRKPVSERLFGDQEISFSLTPGMVSESKPLSLDGSARGVHWSAKPDQDWLSVEPRQGVTPAHPMVRVVPRGPTPDNYSGHVTFTTEDGAASLRTDVKVVIVAPPVTSGAPRSQKDTDATRTPVKGGKGVAPGTESPRQGASIAVGAASAPAEGQQADPQKGAAEKARPVPDCSLPGYTRARNGTLTWQSIRGLETNDFLVIGGADEHLAGGEITGSPFPGCKIVVTSPTPGVKIDEPPRPEDGYRRARLINLSPTPISEVKLRWSIQ